MAFLKAYKIYSAGGVFLALSLFGYFFFFSRASETSVVARIDMYEDVVASGKVVGANSVDVSFGVEGKVEELFVREGDGVKVGDKIAALDIGETEAKIRHLKAQATLARLKLSQLLSGTKKEEIALAESRVEEARTVLETSRKTLEDVKLKAENDLRERYALAADYADTVLLDADNALKALAGIYDERNMFRDIFIIPDSQKKSDAQWQVMFAKTAYDNIAKDHARLKTDSGQAAVDEALGHFKINLEVIRSSLQKTAELLDTAQNIPGTPDIGGYKTTMAVQRSVVNGVQTAILTLEQTIASQKLNNQVAVNQAENDERKSAAELTTREDELALKKATPHQSDAALVQAEIREYESSLDVFEGYKSQAALQASFDGVVVRVLTKQGGFVRAFAPIITLLTPSNIQIELQLDPEQARVVRPGDPVFTEGRDGKKESIGTVATVHQGTVRVYAHEGAGAPSIGSAIAVRIRTMLKKNVLAVDASFVYDENGIKMAYLLRDGEKKKMTILAGSLWRDRIEIQEGLSEGDILVRE